MHKHSTALPANRRHIAAGMGGHTDIPVALLNRIADASAAREVADLSWCVHFCCRLEPTERLAVHYWASGNNLTSLALALCLALWAPNEEEQVVLTTYY